MNNLLFHGLHSLYGDDVVDSTRMWWLYRKGFTRSRIKTLSRKLYGRGFSVIKSIPEDNKDRTDIPAKIRNKFYDYIIFGSIHRCRDYLPLVLENYPVNKIVFVDGEDPVVTPGELFSEKYIYFKREVIDLRKNMFPISFAFIKDRIVNDIGSIKKVKKFGSIIPGDKSTYVYKREESYYKDYQESYFGKTWKKSGWDCMRHYEIMANYCLPYFVGLEDCPANTMTNYPKELGLEANRLAESPELDEARYYEVLNETFEYLKTHLTTEHLAGYVMDRVRNL